MGEKLWGATQPQKKIYMWNKEFFKKFQFMGGGWQNPSFDSPSPKNATGKNYNEVKAHKQYRYELDC